MLSSLFLIVILMSSCCLCDSSRRRLDDDHRLQLHGPESHESTDHPLRFKTSSKFKPTVSLGQVTGVSLTSSGHVLIFHRGSRVWDNRTFLSNNTYALKNEGPINTDTILELDSETGMLIRSWGNTSFYLPHGVTVDFEDNIWLTDVALHQVFKYNLKDLTRLMDLGEPFVPGSDKNHFCKPTSVAVYSKTKHIFVADGYCNSRVIQFSTDGKYIIQYPSSQSPSFNMRFPRMLQSNPYEWQIPHKIVLIEEMGAFCIADREYGRIQCLEINSGQLIQTIQRPADHRIFSIAYSPTCRLIFAVEGPSLTPKPQLVSGFGAEIETGKIILAFAPPSREGKSFSQPHDVAVTRDCNEIFVAEIGPNNVWKFISNSKEERVTTGTSVAVIPAAEVAPAIRSDSSGRQRSQENNITITSYFAVFTIVSVVFFGIYVYKRNMSSSTSRPFFLPMLPRCFTMLMARSPRGNRRETFALSRLLEDPERSGFNRVATTETELDDADLSGDSEVEEFNVSNVRNGKLNV